MQNFKDIPASKLQELSHKYKVESRLLEEILTEWAYFLHLVDDSLSNPDPDEPGDWLERTKDFARLSLFYHEYRENSKSGDSPMFKEVKFIPQRSDVPELKLSRYFANQVFASFLNIIIQGNGLWSKDIALKLLQESHKVGKRPSNKTHIQNSLIVIAHELLSFVGYKVYAPVVQEMLHLSGVGTLSQEAIRQVINRQ